MSNENLESKRWVIAGADIVMQLCLGTVYAWSVYKKPLMAMNPSWAETSIQATMMILMAVIGISAAFGGMLVDKKGPKFVASIGGILFGLGTLIAGYAIHVGSLTLLWLGFGVIAGLGNGFGYVTPIATLIRWFPDKRGLVTGLAVMGFGAGAFFMGKIAPGMILSIGMTKTFYIWGVIFLIAVTGAAQFYKNPPQGWLPEGYSPNASGGVSAADSFTYNDALKTPQWYMLWGMLFLNVSAGLGLISQLSPMAQDVIKKATPEITPAALALAGGSIVAVSAIFNGLGRLFWAWTSDLIGRKGVFMTMFITQAALYIYMPQIANVTLYTVAACYLLACYGGGFATMPAFAADSFGPANIGRIYGMMLTAWGCAGVVGPLVFSNPAIKPIALYVAAGLLIAGFVLTICYKKPSKHQGK